MPYGISQSQVDCAKWATVKQTASGSYVTLACHDTKQAALDQMVAVSMSEKVEPIGDVTVRSRDTEVVLVDLDETLVTKSRYPMRNAVDAVNQLAHGVFIVTGREEAQREQTLDDLQSAGIRYSELFMMPDINMNIAQYKRDTVERLMDEYEVIAFVDDNDENRAAVESLGVYVMTPDEFVDAAFESGLFDIDVDMLEMREINRVAPGFMAASARRGLRLHAEGYSGDGLMPATVADARRMAEGVALSADKWRRIPGWIARHLMDLDAVDGDEITPGLVAMLLWGGGSSKSSARRAQAYAERIVGQLDDDEQRKQPRKPNGQFGSTGGTSTGGDGGTAKPKKGKKPAAKKPAGGQPGSEKYANSTQKNMRAEQASAVGYDALSDTEKAAIVKYTHDGHKQINKSQRGAPPPPLTGQTLEKNKKQADLVDGVIQRTPPLSAPIVVERGVSAKALGVSKSNDIEGLVGSEFADKGIVSTTLSSKVTDKFIKGKEDVTMVINVPKGSKAYAVPDELEFFNPMNIGDSLEREVMLPRNTKFKITAYDQSSGRVFVDVVSTDGRSALDDDEQREQPRKPNGQFGSTGGGASDDDDDDFADDSLDDFESEFASTSIDDATATRIADKIGAKESAFAANNGTLESVVTSDEFDSARESLTEVQKQSRAEQWGYTTTATDGQNMTQIALSYQGSEVAAVVIARDGKGSIAGAMAIDVVPVGFDGLPTKDNMNGYLTLQNMGSTGVADGAGSVLYGRALRQAASTNSGIILDPLDGNAASYWKNMGFESFEGVYALSATSVQKLAGRL